MRLGSTFSNVCLTAASSLCTLAVAEGILRTMPKPPVSNWSRAAFCREPVLRRIMYPHAMVSQLGSEWSGVEMRPNSHGYRDSEWESKAGWPKIMLIGDSFGYGWGCGFDQSIGRLLERNHGYAVYNLCIPGDSFTDYHARYAASAGLIRPNIVVFLVYVNDFFREYPERLSASRVTGNVQAGHKVYNPLCNAYPRNFDDLLNTSYLFSLVNKVRFSGGIIFSSDQQKRELIRRGFQADIDFLSDGARRLGDSPYRYRALVLEAIASAGVVPIVAYIPPFYAVAAQGRKRLESGFGERARRISPEVVDLRLRDLCAARNVAYVSFQKALEAVSDGLYFKADSHWTPLGHAIAARELKPVLESIAGRLDVSRRAVTGAANARDLVAPLPSRAQWP